MNSMLLSGKKFTSTDNLEMSVWLSDVVAEQLNVAVGDEIKLEGVADENLDAESSKCVVMGIYRLDKKLSSFYVTRGVRRVIFKKDIDVMFVYAQKVSQFNETVSRIENIGASAYFGDTKITNLLLLLYTVFSIAIFLSFLVLCMTISFVRMYYFKRISYFTILRVLGLTKKNVAWNMSILIQIVFTLAYGIAIGLSFMLNGYLVSKIEDVIGKTELNSNPFTITTFFLFVILSCINMCVSFISVESKSKKDVTFLLRHEN